MADTTAITADSNPFALQGNDLDTYLEACRERTQATWQRIAAAVADRTRPALARIDTGEAALILNHVSFAMGETVERVLAGQAAVEYVSLTSDGRGAELTKWHEGPANEWVYVERWSPRGREFHGWVDSVSRRLLQTG